MPSYAPPQTPLQQELASLWGETLRIDRPGIDDDFFDLGGHSLLAIRMLGRVHEQLGVRLHLSRFAEEPTIRSLAGAVTAARAAAAGAAVTP